LGVGKHFWPRSSGTESASTLVSEVGNISSLVGVGSTAAQVGYDSAEAGINGKTPDPAMGRSTVNSNAVAWWLIRARLTEAAAGTGSINIERAEINAGVNPDFIQSLKTGSRWGVSAVPSETAAAVYPCCIPISDDISAYMICGGGHAFDDSGYRPRIPRVLKRVAPSPGPSAGTNTLRRLWSRAARVIAQAKTRCNDRLPNHLRRSGYRWWVRA
jgi:hypothetical protein